MRVIVFLCVALAIPIALCYDEKFDKIDVDKITADDALFTAYIDCMLNKGPCNLELSEEFKSLLPEVIATACENCSPIQKQAVRKTVKALSEKKPAEFNQFRQVYDPDGKYEASFASFLLATE